MDIKWSTQKIHSGDQIKILKGTLLIAIEVVGTLNPSSNFLGGNGMYYLFNLVSGSLFFGFWPHLLVFSDNP